jgi:hypothetical protein
MSTLNGGPGNIVTSGLVLYLDAANYLSYTSGSTTWNDLSGNNNSGSLVNGPTFSSTNAGSIVFDGTNDYVSIPNSTSLNFSTLNQLSINIWFYTTNNTADQFLIYRNSTSATGWVLETSGQGIIMQIGNGTTLYTASSNTQSYLGTIVNVQVTLDGSTLKIYRNSIQVNSTSFTGTIYNTTAPILLGFGTSQPRYLNGNIYQTSIYNRALSADEVLQNYNAIKGRFGL